MTYSKHIRFNAIKQMLNNALFIVTDLRHELHEFIGNNMDMPTDEPTISSYRYEIITKNQNRILLPFNQCSVCVCVYCVPKSI